MRDFSAAELEYLSERRLGRLATVDLAGRPHVVPIGMWQVNSSSARSTSPGTDSPRRASSSMWPPRGQRHSWSRTWRQAALGTLGL